MKEHLTNPVFKIISEEAAQLKIDAYVIGGFVRDLHLNRDSKDIDIVAVGKGKGDKTVGITLAEAVAKRLKVNVHVFKNFGTAQLKFDELDIEFEILKNMQIGRAHV